MYKLFKNSHLFIICQYIHTPLFLLNTVHFIRINFEFEHKIPESLFTNQFTPPTLNRHGCQMEENMDKTLHLLKAKARPNIYGKYETNLNAAD